MKIPFIFNCLFFLLAFFAKAQLYNDSDLENSKYFEDQFYIATGYNFLTNRPEDVVQRNLSYNLQTGFIKDIPLNKRRNVALGLGLGYGVNSYYTNVIANADAGVIGYTISDNSDFRRSKLETHALELPFELRWRTSTATEYKFWRIYTGFKIAYVFAKSSKVVVDGNVDSFTNEDIENLQYGVMVNFGFNTWNIHTYYGLNPLLKEGVTLTNGSPFEMRTFRVGLIFYIL